MALTYRSNTQAGNASGGSLVVTKPTGVADGDVLIAVGYLESDTNSWTTVPSGWSLVRTNSNAGAFRQDVWLKRAASEGASWTWAPNSSNWRGVTVLAYSGQTGSGSTLYDVLGTAEIADADTVPQAPSATTTVNSETVLAIHSNYAGLNGTETGFATTERADNGTVIVSEGTQATAGATGTTTFSVGTVDHASFHLALLNDTGGGAAATSAPPFVPSFAHLIGR